MITYDLSQKNGPLYVCLYQRLKEDILEERLHAGEKMPSKRNLARNLGISTVTVENSYGQLASEGYIYSIPKKGYFVSDISGMKKVRAVPRTAIRQDACGKAAGSAEIPPEAPARTAPVQTSVMPADLIDLSSNRTETANFPFSVWSRLMREALSEKATALLHVSESTGVRELREAIASHLSSYRGMAVDPEQIVVGAGTEYLYSLIINLLGRDRIYCVENPGYKKLKQIYESNDAACVYAGLDENGIRMGEIRRNGAEILHISPTHHFPTGITMPVSRRYELLGWAGEAKGRYIIEDDYDSEFRLNGMPIPPLFNIDADEKVIYMNTFSKSLTPTIRISYMVLPAHLMDLYRRKLSFYSCTVPTFEQYTLAAFISQGYFEKHINRMRLYYRKKRALVMEIVRSRFPETRCRIVEHDSGLHFIVRFETALSDAQVREMLLAEGIRIQAVSDYYFGEHPESGHAFILNYSGLDTERLPEAAETIDRVLFSETRKALI